MKKPTILLCPGHGSDTPGKRSPIWPDGSQLFEWEWNRELCEIIRIRLEALGYRVVNISPERKDVGRGERVRRMNAEYTKNGHAWALSIHGNAANANKANGFEVFTHPSASKTSKILAKELYLAIDRNLEMNLRPDYSDGNPDKSALFTVLTCQCPIILSENGFYTNQAECRWMLSVEALNSIAQCHVEAIESTYKYFSLK